MTSEKNPTDQWYKIDNEDIVPSPSLFIYPDRVEENIRRMISEAGGTERLRPHVKTHKMPAIVNLLMKYGVTKFKSATIAEAEMAASCGAKEVLLAVQPVGPNLKRFFSLKKKFHSTEFSCIADSEIVIRQLSQMSATENAETTIWLDINNGMNRTGITPGKDAGKLYMLITELPLIRPGGLHVYDGHIRENDPELRKKECNDSMKPVLKLIGNLNVSGYKDIRIIAGGTPTFPVHAHSSNFELSPGTLILWDHGYSSSYEDMNFLHAAILITRVISKPGKDLLCLDLGHKAVASEMPQPRVRILGIEEYKVVGHNEEHMVISSVESAKFRIGDVLYCIPYHICPTVDRFDKVYAVNENIVTEEWPVEARKRVITI